MESASGPVRVGDRPRMVIAGLSRSETCGVFDHAMLLKSEFETRGFEVDLVWSTELKTGRRAVTRTVVGWANDIVATAADATGVIVSYSVFSHGWRGFPVGIRALKRALENSPAVLLLHEAAYHFSFRPLRLAWFFGHRMALRHLLQSGAAAAVTTPGRQRWLSSRWWLPSTPAELIPVSATLPWVSVQHDESRPMRIAVLGFGSPSAAIDLVVGGLALLRERGPLIEVVLFGQPGPESSEGRRWTAAAKARQVRLEWSYGPDAVRLAEELTRCHVAIYADRHGASGRRTWVANALSLSVPVVGFPGSQHWPDLAHSGGLVLAEPDQEALATALHAIAGDPYRRKCALQTYREHLAIEHAVGRLLGLCQHALAQRPLC